MRDIFIAVAVIPLPVVIAVQLLTVAHRRAEWRRAMERRYGATPWHLRDWRDR